MAARPRDVDKLDALPDEKIKEQDKRYLSCHKVDELLGDIMRRLLEHGPADPVQYIIDSLSLDYELAMQDPKTGLSMYRKKKLLELFKIMDKDGSGKLSFRKLQDYSNQYGGMTLSYNELCSIFKDFQAGSDEVTLEEFLVFFSKVSRTKTNQEFATMIQEMAA